MTFEESIMDDHSISLSFGNSLTKEVSCLAEEYAEIGLDALADDSLFKDIPFISTAISMYRIGKSIRERHYVSKLITFLDEINKGVADEEKREEYRGKFAGNEKFRNQELEYILILIDRYIGADKAQILARLYLAYLDGKIQWIEFTQYAEVFDRLLPGDIYLSSDGFKYDRRKMDSKQRLAALGLLKGVIPKSREQHGVISSVSYNLDYEITKFGTTLLKILNPKIIEQWIF